MSSRATKRAAKILSARQTDYDKSHDRDEGFKRPGSLNPHKSRSVKTKR